MRITLTQTSAPLKGIKLLLVWCVMLISKQVSVELLNYYSCMRLMCSLLDRDFRGENMLKMTLTECMFGQVCVSFYI